MSIEFALKAVNKINDGICTSKGLSRIYMLYYEYFLIRIYDITDCAPRL